MYKRTPHTRLLGLSLPITNQLPINLDKYNVIIDAIFGFSFGTRVRTSTEMLCSPLNSVPIYHQWWTMLFSGPSTGTI